MQIRLIAVGKLRERSIAAACAEFEKRLGPYYPFETVEVKAGLGSQPEAAMREEGARILSAIAPDDRVWILERTGKEFSSEELSAALERTGNEGVRRLVLVIGGTYGLDPAVMQRAQFTWSLSRLTFLHEWARMIVIEQLYRAAKIARGEPYHH